MSLLYYPVALAWMLVCFTLMVLLRLVTAPFDKQRVAVHFLSRLWDKSFVWLNPLWSMEVKGAENIVKGGRYVITVNHQSKNICQIEHTRHRSWENFLVNMISGLIAYSFLLQKSSLNFEVIVNYQITTTP